MPALKLDLILYLGKNMKLVLFFLLYLVSYAAGAWRYYGAEPSLMAKKSIFVDGKIYAYGYPDYLAVGTNIQNLQQIPIDKPVSIWDFLKTDNAYYIFDGFRFTAFRSTDLKTWTPLPFSHRENLKYSTFKNFIYGKCDSIFRYSTDGIVWDTTVFRSSTGKALSISNIWDNEQTVFVKVPGDSVYSSTDLKTWKYNPYTCNSSKGNCYSLYWVAWLGSKFLAIQNSDSIVFESSDGVNWLVLDTLHNSQTKDMSVHNEKVLVRQTLSVPGSPQKWIYRISSDGKNWVDAPFGVQTLYTGSGWYSSNGAQFQTSTDGVSWSTANPVKDQGTGPLYSTIWDGTKFIASSMNGIFSSTDGVSWSKKSSTTGIKHLFHEGPQWIGFGDQGRIFSSSDGLQWVERESNTSEDLMTLRWFGDHYIVEGSNYMGKSAVLKSTDGIVWDSLPLLLSRFWDGSKYYMLGRQYLITSPDGIDLDTIYKFKDTGCTMYCISYPEYITMSHDTLFLFSNVPNVSGSGGSELYISPDRGVTWTDTVSGPSFFTDIRSYGGFYFARNSQPGNQTMLMVSRNMVKWDSVGHVIPFYGVDIASDGDSVVVVTDVNLWAKRALQESPSRVAPKSITNGSQKLLVQKGSLLHLRLTTVAHDCSLVLYNLKGELVAELWNGFLEAGNHSFPLQSLEAGVYLVKFSDSQLGSLSNLIKLGE